MGALSIHNLDPETERRIRERAKQAGKSISQTATELLAEAVGCGEGQSKKPVDYRSDLLDLFGTWTEKQFREFEKAIEDSERIDPEDWQ